MLPRLSLFHIRKINADFYASRSLSSRMTRKTILSQLLLSGKTQKDKNQMPEAQKNRASGFAF